MYSAQSSVEPPPLPSSLPQSTQAKRFNKESPKKSRKIILFLLFLFFAEVIFLIVYFYLRKSKESKDTTFFPTEAPRILSPTPALSEKNYV